MADKTFHKMIEQSAAPNAGGLRQSAIRESLTVRVGQFCRWRHYTL